MSSPREKYQLSTPGTGRVEVHLQVAHPLAEIPALSMLRRRAQVAWEEQKSDFGGFRILGEAKEVES